MASYKRHPACGGTVATRRSLLALLTLLAVSATGCGGARSGPTVQGPAPTPTFTAVDEQRRLSEEQRAALAEAGFHTEGLLQGLPTDCRLAEGTAGGDGHVVSEIVAELGGDVARGPMVAVEASDDTTLLATTLVATDWSVGEAAVWAVDGNTAAITAANALAGELTTFELEPITMTAGTPASSVMGGAVDCSWIVADVTHTDPPELEPEMRPDLLALDPPRAEPGQLLAMRFPEGTMRGVAFQLDRRTGEGWEPVAWMTSDGNGGEPITVPAFTEGYAVEDVGVGGPGPDHVRLPDDVPSGEYRVCTANAGDEFCAPLEIVTG